MEIFLPTAFYGTETLLKLSSIVKRVTSNQKRPSVIFELCAANNIPQTHLSLFESEIHIFAL